MKEFEARLILCEFKNYDEKEVGKQEVNQLRNYLGGSVGRLGILCTNKKPGPSAYRKRNTVFSEENKMIVFLTKADLEKMVMGKVKGVDPGVFVLDHIEWFYLQQE